MAADGHGTGSGEDAARALRAAYLENAERERTAERRGDAPLISIVIPVLNQRELTRHCLASIEAHTARPYEVILVDNGSTEDIAACVASSKPTRGRIVLLQNERNEGFAYAVNQGLARATGSVVVVLNNDTRVTPEWATRSIALLNAHPRIGVVGPVTNRASGPQVLSTVGYDVNAPDAGLDTFARSHALAHTGQFVLLARLVGLCMVVKRELLERIGGFDPCFGLGNFEDDDFSLRAMRAGFRLAVARDVFVHHHGSATFREQKFDAAGLMRANWEWFCAKYDFDGTLGVPYPATKLALARPFDAARDVVPLRPSEVFAHAKPLALRGVRSTRVLAIADGCDERWFDAVRDFCASHGPNDDVTLIVRVEPATKRVLDAVGSKLEALVAQVGDAAMPDVLVDATPIAPAARGGLYAAVSAWLPTASARNWIHEREAALAGVPTFAGAAAHVPSSMVPAAGNP
jgi:GT2 family glycosyltransferase